MASILQNLRVRAASIWTAGVSDVRGSHKYLSKYTTEFKSNPIDPPTDYNLARFAVDQHNLKKNANLEFVKVVDRKQYSGTGIFYYLTLEAKDGEKVNVYEAQIWDRPWLNLQQLSTFKLVDGDDDDDDDDLSVNVAKSQKQSPDNNTGIKSKPFIRLSMNDLACLAVDQHNLNKNANLKFLEVLDIKKTLVAGFSYDITLKAEDGEKVNIYEANIWERSWLNSRKLTMFKRLKGAFYKLEDHPTNISLARFAVNQQNKKKNIDILEFVKVVDVKEYCNVDDGMLYYIILLAKGKVGKKVNVYGAEILKKDGNLKELKELNLLGEGPFNDSAKSQEQLQDKFKITKSSMYKIVRKYVQY